MKRINILAIAIVTLLWVGSAFALPVNLPHHNRSDVDDAVKVFIPWNSFGLTADGTSVLSIGSGTPRVAEVNSLGIGAIDFDSTTDAVHLFYPIPDNMCVDCQTKISVVWSTSSTTTTQTATWRVRYSDFAAGAAIAAASTALDTAITADSVDDTAYGLNETAQGILNANTFDRGNVAHFNVELSAVSGLNPASDTVFFHGIFVEYVREKL